VSFSREEAAMGGRERFASLALKVPHRSSGKVSEKYGWHLASTETLCDCMIENLLPS
jgi:hypothetical protein